MDKAARPFVCASFAASYSKYSGLGDRRADFDRAVMAPFERALDANAPEVLVLASSPDDYAGWVLTQGTSLVYLYVKEAFRDRGVGRSLLDANLERCVFQTPAGIRLQQHKFGRALRLAPFLLLATRAEQREAA